MRVLLVDDEPDVLLLCRVNLEIAGHEVLEAATGERGLELALGEVPDVIVLDVILPAKDGLAVLAVLAADRRTGGTPVILLTAKTQIDDRLAGWRAGCTEYVTKPFCPVALTELLDRVVEMRPGERLAHRNREIARLARA
ncbi:MAG: response regulator transcription factor [Actinomycetota bacterium]